MIALYFNILYMEDSQIVENNTILRSASDLPLEKTVVSVLMPNELIKKIDDSKGYMNRSQKIIDILANYFNPKECQRLAAKE